MPSQTLLQSSIPSLPVRRGKVRDVYDLGHALLLVSTDRLSAFDWILPTGIPDKGRVLTQLSAWWFDRSGEHHQVLTLDPAEFGLPAGTDLDALAGRSMLVKKTTVIPIECVARGYLVGSGWKEYQKSQTVCGIELPAGLRDGDRLPEPIFTPATKAESGHDENIPFERMIEIVGLQTAVELRTRTMALYSRGAKTALERGIIIADTKFEWGRDHDGEIILIDEVLTPDSSRFWPADDWRPGQTQPSFDKQFVRNWLERTDWDKNSPPPALPDDIVAQTRARYIEAYEKLTGKIFE